jgi:hypothetical protein
MLIIKPNAEFEERLRLETLIADLSSCSARRKTGRFSPG